MFDEHPEVKIETPELTVTVSAAVTLDKAKEVAVYLFDKYSKPDTRLGSTGFSLPERRDVPEVQPGTMPLVPRDFPHR